MQTQLSSIEVKLNNHGRYTWKINVNYDTDFESAVLDIKRIDQKLRDQFPDVVSKGAGRVSNFEDES